MKRDTLPALSILAVLLIGLFAGVLFAASLAISPSLALLDASHYTLVKQEQIRILQVSMSTISGLYTLLALAIMIIARKRKLKILFQYTLSAFILIMIALIYSGFTDIPYNQAILKWAVNDPPDNWSQIRHLWDMANLIRTVPSVIAFILQSVGLLHLTDKSIK